MEVIYKFRKKLTIMLEQRDQQSPMGRFGGGWNWEFGFQIGGKNLILNLFALSVRFEW